MENYGDNYRTALRHDYLKHVDLAPQRHIGMGRDVVPFDQPVDGRVALVAVKSVQGGGDLVIGHGAAGVVADVIVPGGDVIAFRPVVGLFQIAQQHP
jgi:hypothetical protein